MRQGETEAVRDEIQKGDLVNNFIMTSLQTVMIGAAVLLAGSVALSGFTRVTAEDGESNIQYSWSKIRTRMLVAGIVVALSATVAFVPRGYAGVIYDWDGGIVQNELSEGVHFVVPFKQHVTNVNTQVHAWVYNNPAVFVHTQDFHEIRVPFAINYRVRQQDAAFVLQNVSGNPAETILSHAALQSLRTEVGQIKLDSLAQSVTDIALAIQETIEPQANAYGLEIVFVAVEDAVVNAEFIAAVNRERISERDIITARNNVQIATENAKQAVATATGEAEALLLLAEAREAERTLLGMSPTEYVWFKNWDGILPTTMLGTDGEFIVNLP